MCDTICFTQSASKHLMLSFKENTSMFWLRCSRDTVERASLVVLASLGLSSECPSQEW